MIPRKTVFLLACLSLLVAPRRAAAQIDPSKRQLIQFGYNQPLEGKGPIAGYAFYFLNQPGYLRTNITLRLAVAPVYLDSEIGFDQALGPNTDLAVGISGGGFADSHEEIRGGRYLTAESFTGHGAEISTSVYHLFNPANNIPLYGVLRVGYHFTDYTRDADNPAGFVIPDNRNSFRLRTGFRFGGREPLLTPALAMELSGWYEAHFYNQNGPFGFAGDRIAQSQTHFFWSRALLAYTFPKRGNYLATSVTAGTSLRADRLNAYPLGGALPLGSEFPLYLPGYYFGEISARRYVLAGGLYAHPLPFGLKNTWTVNVFGTTANVDYVSGMQQPGHWHNGVGGGIGYRSKDGVWQAMFAYGFGLDATRGAGTGAHSVGLLLQYDLETRQRLKPTFEPGVGPDKSRFMERLIRRLSIFN